MRSQLLITCVCLLAAFGCRKDKTREAQAPSQPTSADGASARGLANAEAMVANAKLCEPQDSPVDLLACEKACGLNHSNSCANWGQLLAKSDANAARALYDRACKGGSGIGCESRARLAALNNESDAAERFATARNYHRVHCAQGYARSCAQLAALYEEGLGGRQDTKTASEFASRACRLGHKASCARKRRQ